MLERCGGLPLRVPTYCLSTWLVSSQYDDLRLLLGWLRAPSISIPMNKAPSFIQPLLYSVGQNSHKPTLSHREGTKATTYWLEECQVILWSFLITQTVNRLPVRKAIKNLQLCCFPALLPFLPPGFILITELSTWLGFQKLVFLAPNAQALNKHYLVPKTYFRSRIKIW